MPLKYFTSGYLADTDMDFPKTRGDCIDGPRPCPWLECRYHLCGSVSNNFTCSLDVADEGTHTLEEVAEIMELDVDVVESIERRAFLKLRVDPKVRTIATGDE